MERSSSETANKRIKFENPPINELVMALYHLPIMDMKAQHIGLYWNRIRDRYPSCEQRPMVASGEGSPYREAPNEVFPLPRFWFFRDQNDPTLIQIQRNAFLFNWRRRGDGGEANYPHYETVAQDFWQEFGDYHAFIQEWGWEGLDTIRRCELNYINVISTNEIFANPAQLMNVLPPITNLSALQTDDRRMIEMNTTVTYQMNENLNISMNIRLGRRTDTNELAAILDLKAHGAPSVSFEELRSWYDSAHEAVHKMFLDATSPEAKEIWRPL